MRADTWPWAGLHVSPGLTATSMQPTCVTVVMLPGVPRAPSQSPAALTPAAQPRCSSVPWSSAAALRTCGAPLANSAACPLWMRGRVGATRVHVSDALPPLFHAIVRAAVSVPLMLLLEAAFASYITLTQTQNGRPVIQKGNKKASIAQ